MYARYQEVLLKTHGLFQSLYESGATLPSSELQDLAHTMLVSNYERLLEHTLLEGKLLRSTAARGMQRILQSGRIKTNSFCRVHPLALPAG